MKISEHAGGGRGNMKDETTWKEDERFRKYFYLASEKFEQVVSVFLTILIALVILVALWRISKSIYLSMIVSSGPLRYQNFTEIFGMALTLLIGIEFMNSIVQVILDHDRRKLARNVLLIAVLALARKLIVMDFSKYSPWMVAALGFALVCIGGLYFVLRCEREETIPRFGAPKSAPEAVPKTDAPQPPEPVGKSSRRRKHETASPR